MSVLARDSFGESEVESEVLFSSPVRDDGGPTPCANISERPQAMRRLFQEENEAPNPKAPRGNAEELILQELRKTNSRLDVFAGHLESLEKRLASVETSMTPSSSSGLEVSGGVKKRKIPAKVSVCSCILC